MRWLEKLDTSMSWLLKSSACSVLAPLSDVASFFTCTMSVELRCANSCTVSLVRARSRSKKSRVSARRRWSLLRVCSRASRPTYLPSFAKASACSMRRRCSLKACASASAILRRSASRKFSASAALRRSVAVLLFMIWVSSLSLSLISRKSFSFISSSCIVTNSLCISSLFLMISRSFRSCISALSLICSWACCAFSWYTMNSFSFASNSISIRSTLSSAFRTCARILVTLALFERIFLSIASRADRSSWISTR
mmetsp:Transcript_21647/g.43463  ORF Transcript_21647/g.43463 Transcript_21647/m.43463 type:complete len:254 (+) Transcript_21647:213-974(+)